MKRVFLALLCAAFLLAAMPAGIAAGKVSGIGSEVLNRLQEQTQTQTQEQTQTQTQPQTVGQFEANIQAVRDMLDAEGLRYTQQGDDGDVFTLGVKLDGALNSCKVWIFVYEYGVHFQSDYEVSAAAGVRDEVAKFMIMENETLLITSYYMDYEDGLMGSQYFVLSGEQTPQQELLSDALWLTVNSLDDVSEQIVNILYNKKTAEEMFAAYP